MPRRPKAPNKLRFLSGFLWGLPGLFIAIGGQAILQSVCTMPIIQAAQVECPELPALFYVVLLGFFFAGTAYSAYRWWRDYPCGELWLDN